MAAGLAASVVAGTTRTIAALRALATRTLTALEVLAVALGGTLGASRGLGLIQTIERDLTAIVDLDDDDLDLVAHVEDVLDLLHATLGNAGDVQQAVLAGQQVDEGAEGLDGDHATGVLLARLGNLDDELDALDGLVDGLAGATDKDGAVLLDVDRSAGLVLDTADDLTAGTDDVADLVGRNLDGNDARAVLRVVWRGSGITSSIFCRMKARPSLACCRARARMSKVRPVALLSICRAVMPSVVPVTLKSMSPRKSSRPWMSDRTTVLPSSWIRPMAIPETGRLMGTPPSIRASVEPQVEAIEEEPLDSMTSETTRMA